MNHRLFSVEGKVAIVTGSSHGIGGALAVGFAWAGASVVLVARSTDKLEGRTQFIASRGGKTVSVPVNCSGGTGRIASYFYWTLIGGPGSNRGPQPKREFISAVRRPQKR